MKLTFFKQITAIAMIVVITTSCASTTLIKTEASGVKVYADGNFLGTAPVTYSDTKIVGSTTTIMLKKEGCTERTFAVSRSEEFQVGPCIGGVFVLVPFLWVMGYKPERTFQFECEAKK